MCLCVYNIYNIIFVSQLRPPREEQSVDPVLRRLPSRRQRLLGLNRLWHHLLGSQTKAWGRRQSWNMLKHQTDIFRWVGDG